MNNDQDRRVLLAIALTLLVWLGWSWFAAPPLAPKPTPEASPAAADGSGGPVPSAAATPRAPAAPVETPCTGTGEVLATEIASLKLGDCGGLRAVELVGREAPITVTPWWLWAWRKVSFQSPGPWSPYGESMGVEHLLSESGAFGLPGAGPFGARGTWSVQRAGDGLRAERVTPDGLRIVQELKPGADPDRFVLRVRYEATAGAVDGPFWIGVSDRFADIGDLYDVRPRLEAVVDGDLENLQTPSELGTEELFEGPVSWVGVADRYFLAALQIPGEGWGTYRHVRTGELTGGYVVSSTARLEPGAAIDASFDVYVGPKEVERLDVLGGGLEEGATLGFFGFFAKILLFFLHIFYAAIPNWGVAIIALTFLVRASFYPLAAKAFRSGKAMQAIQPKLKEIQEKYADDREAQTRETMKLLQEHGVNPLSGCFPLLVQMPVFFALYSALLQTPALYHADFAYIRDLSMPDPFGLFPALMIVGMVFQQRMTPLTGMDPTQAQMMRLMPYLFGLFMFNVPAGLSLYYVVNTVLAILQQWYNTRSYASSQAATPAPGVPT